MYTTKQYFQSVCVCFIILIYAMLAFRTNSSSARSQVILYYTSYSYMMLSYTIYKGHYIYIFKLYYTSVPMENTTTVKLYDTHKAQ